MKIPFNFQIKLEAFSPEEFAYFAKQCEQFSEELFHDTSFQIPSNWLPVKSNTWRQLVTCGDYGHHKQHGNIEFTPRHLDSFYDNWKSGVFGRDLWFNFNHNSRGPSALWIWDLKKVLSADGQTQTLLYRGEYTPLGLKSIIGKEYKYLSIEFFDDYQGHGPTLVGVACTNNPFVVGSGLSLLENTTKEVGKPMTLEELQAAFEEQKTELEAQKAKVAKLEAENKAEKVELERQVQEEKQKALDAAENKALENESEQVKKLSAELKAMKAEQIDYRQKLLEANMDAFKKDMMTAGIPKEPIEKALEYVGDTQNAPITLEATPGRPQKTNILNMAKEILLSIPASNRVKLEAVEGSEVWVDYNKLTAAASTSDNADPFADVREEYNNRYDEGVV